MLVGTINRKNAGNKIRGNFCFFIFISEQQLSSQIIKSFYTLDDDTHFYCSFLFLLLQGMIRGSKKMF